MQCHLLFFYSKQIKFSFLLKFLRGIPEPYHVITNSISLHEFLKKNDKKTKNFRDIFPHEGKLAEEVFQEARKLKEQYRQLYDDVIFKGIEVFKGFEYQLLQEITIIIQCKKILQKNKNTVFVFELFHPAYFAIMKIANELGYENDLKIGFVCGDKIKYIQSNDERDPLSYTNKTSRMRAMNFVRGYLGKDFSFENLSGLIKFGVGVSSLNLRKVIQKKRGKTTSSSINSILKKIDKKIIGTSAGYNTNNAIFITAARFDLFFRPLLPALKKFYQKKLPIQIFTSDMITSLVLSKNKISFISLFEEVNLLMELIERSEEGQQIVKKIKNYDVQNNDLVGINELLPDILRKTYRTISIIIILEHIFSKMKLKSILDGGSTEMFENLAIQVAKKSNVTSFTLIPSPPTPTPQFAEGYHADKLFLEGSQGVEVFKGLGYNEERFVVVGGARYDNYKNIDSEKSKKVLEKKNNISSKTKLIVIAMSRWHDNDENWISDFIKFCHKNNFQVIIKIHPMYKIYSRDLNENKIKVIKQRCKNSKYLLTQDLDLITILSAADIVITDWSSVGLEAILLDRPLVQVSFTRQEIEKYVRYFDYGAALLIEQYKELEKKIVEILHEKKYLKELKEGREKITEKYNFCNDGKAAQRIFENLVN